MGNHYVLVSWPSWDAEIKRCTRFHSRRFNCAGYPIAGASSSCQAFPQAT
jgi:hypothetical protein